LRLTRVYFLLLSVLTFFAGPAHNLGQIQPTNCDNETARDSECRKDAEEMNEVRINL